MIRVVPSFVPLAAPVAVALLSAGALAACGSSPSASGSPSTSSSAPSVTIGAPSTAPSLSALCTGLNSADLSTLSQAKDPVSMEAAWARLAADAPDAIKADMQTIDGFLKATASRDYTSLASMTTQLQTALAHIETYIATNCHA